MCHAGALDLCKSPQPWKAQLRGERTQSVPQTPHFPVCLEFAPFLCERVRCWVLWVVAAGRPCCSLYWWLPLFSSLPAGSSSDWRSAAWGYQHFQSHRAPELLDTSYVNGCSLSLFLAGCEFFKEYKDRDYTAEGLIFNWKQVRGCYKMESCGLCWA